MAPASRSESVPTATQNSSRNRDTTIPAQITDLGLYAVDRLILTKQWQVVLGFRHGWRGVVEDNTMVLTAETTRAERTVVLEQFRLGIVRAHHESSAQNTGEANG